MSKNDPEALARKERKERAAKGARIRGYQTMFTVLAGMLGVGAYVAFRIREWAIVGGLALPLLLALIVAARLEGKRRSYQGPQGKWRERELISEKPDGL